MSTRKRRRRTAAGGATREAPRSDQVTRWLSRQAKIDPSGAIHVVAFALAVGRTWRALVEAGVPWEAAVCVADATELTPCGLPMAFCRGTEGAIASLAPAQRALLDAILPPEGGEGLFMSWGRAAQEEAHRRLVLDSAEEADGRLAGLEVMASLLETSAAFARLEGASAETGRAMRVALEIQFSPEGWPESFRLNPRVVEVHPGPGGELGILIRGGQVGGGE